MKAFSCLAFITAAGFNLTVRADEFNYDSVLQCVVWACVPFDTYNYHV